MPQRGLHRGRARHIGGGGGGTDGTGGGTGGGRARRGLQPIGRPARARPPGPLWAFPERPEASLAEGLEWTLDDGTLGHAGSWRAKGWKYQPWPTRRSPWGLVSRVGWLQGVPAEVRKHSLQFLDNLKASSPQKTLQITEAPIASENLKPETIELKETQGFQSPAPVECKALSASSVILGKLPDYFVPPFSSSV